METKNTYLKIGVDDTNSVVSIEYGLPFATAKTDNNYIVKSHLFKFTGYSQKSSKDAAQSFDRILKYFIFRKSQKRELS